MGRSIRETLEQALYGANGNGHAPAPPSGPDIEGLDVPAPAPWPVLEPAARHGLIGRIVDAIEPETESDPVAVLVQGLVAFGSAVGRGPYVQVEGHRHHVNLFTVLVGKSASGRKGTSWSRAWQLMERAANDWTSGCVKSGLASGEGIIWSVRDARRSEGDDDKEDRGAKDKRLMVVETEFASVLKTMQRDGNTLSPVIRQCWDTGSLATLTKNSPTRATGAHVSIIGHITEAELAKAMRNTEAMNGFANRFLWVCVKRSKLLPEGGRAFDAAPLALELSQALAMASTAREMRWDDSGRKLWHRLYLGELNEERPGTVYAAITARAAPQVLRLAMLYALLDVTDFIDQRHLEAAMTVWRYCDASARRIFPEAAASELALKILGMLRGAPDGMTKTEISTGLGKHARAEDIVAALGELLSIGAASGSKEPTGRGGRPAERWRAS